jgi:hypothetical protein
MRSPTSHLSAQGVCAIAPAIWSAVHTLRKVCVCATAPAFCPQCSVITGPQRKVCVRLVVIGLHGMENGFQKVFQYSGSCCGILGSRMDSDSGKQQCLVQT